MRIPFVVIKLPAFAGGTSLADYGRKSKNFFFRRVNNKKVDTPGKQKIKNKKSKKEPPHFCGGTFSFT
jgi:hypothetical protein